MCSTCSAKGQRGGKSSIVSLDWVNKIFYHLSKTLDYDLIKVQNWEMISYHNCVANEKHLILGYHIR